MGKNEKSQCEAKFSKTKCNVFSRPIIIYCISPADLGRGEGQKLDDRQVRRKILSYRILDVTAKKDQKKFLLRNYVGQILKDTKDTILRF